jgi:hypothetical protein
MAAFLDVCRFIPTAGGTTDWTYASAVGGCQSPTAANAANGTVYKLLAVSNDLTQWEIAEGAYTSSGAGSFARTTVLYNSAGTGTKTPGQSGAASKINFSTVPQVAVIGVKEDLISVEEANSFTVTQQQQARSNIGMPVGQIPGTTGTTQPAAGMIGERIQTGIGATITSSGAVFSCGNITLTPGVWDIDACWVTGGPGATATTDIAVAIATSSTTTSGIANAHYRLPAMADVSMTITVPRTRVVVSANTTYLANIAATYSGSGGYGTSGVLAATRVS